MTRADNTPGGSNDFEKLRNMTPPPSPGGSSQTAEPVLISFVLKMPGPNAKQVDQIKGSVQVLAGGEQKDVEVTDVLKKVGTEVADPALKRAGLTVKLIKVEPNTDPPPFEAARDSTKPDSQGEESFGETLTLEVTGPEESLLQVSLRAGGEDLNTGMSWSNDGEKSTYNIPTSNKIPADARLVLQVAVDQKPVTVPFEFKSVPLPAKDAKEGE
jgi:hypothetical protein